MLGISSSFTDGREVQTELITNSTFISGRCGNTLISRAKPRIYLLSNDSVLKHQGIPSIAVVLKQCLDERDEKDVVILCNSILDVNRTKAALDLWKKPFAEYVPYLRRTVPASSQKNYILNELSSNTDTIVVSEYRGFRGCEASHSIIFLDFENPIPGGIMAEMLSRTLVDVDFIALPRKEPTPGAPIKNIIEDTFNTWISQDLIETRNIEFHDEDKFSITFSITDSSQKSTLVEIEEPEAGFILPESSEHQRQIAYL